MPSDLADEVTSENRPMDLDHVFLDPCVKVEPLVDRWYAWTHLLAPAQQALNLAFRYLPALKSFTTAPGVHLAAARDPNMFGGPFVDLPESATRPAADYISETTSRRARALEFANQFRDFDTRLQASASGYSLREFWDELPDALKGRVELVYGLNYRPKIRILEEMFVDDDLGLAEAQAVLLHRTPDHERKFFLATPKLDGTSGLYIQAPLGGEGVRALCQARHQATNLNHLAELLGVPVAQLAPYFTDRPPVKSDTADFEGPGVRLRYFGHACILIQTPDVNILIDPTFALDQVPGESHLRLTDLPDRIDILALSHTHQDHACIETLMQIRDRVASVIVPRSNSGELADPSAKRILRSLGFQDIRELDPLDRVEFPGGALTSLPFSGEHCDLDVHSKQCLMIDTQGRKICFLVDSDAIDIHVYRRISSKLRNPDLLLIGMECNGAPLSWLYGPLASSPVSKRNDNSRRLSGANFKQAWDVVEELQPKCTLVYAMGQEIWMRHMMGLSYKEDSIQLLESSELVNRCRDIGIESERVIYKKDIILEPVV